MKERGPDLAMLVLGLVIAAAARATSFAALLGSMAVAFLLVNAARALDWPRSLPSLPRGSLLLGLAVLLAVPAYELGSRARPLAEYEGLLGLAEHVSDRLRIEESPSLAPPLVPGDRPLTYFVHASGAHVRVRLGPELSWIDAEGLGHGVFRIDYDPREHGAPEPSAHASLATIDVDGHESTRSLIAATPPPHPRWLRLSPDRTRACAPSEETDQVLVLDAASEAPTRIEALDGPTDCALTDDGGLVVVHRYAPELLVVRDGARRTIALGATGAASLALTPDAMLVAIDGAAGELVRVSRDAAARVDRVALAGHPTFVVTSGTAALVTTTAPAALVRVALDPLAVAGTRTLVTPAVHAAVRADGAVVLALTDFVDEGAPHLGNHFVEDRLATFDGATLRLLEDRPTARRTPRQDHAGDVDRGASPMGLSFTARGTLLVAFAGTDEVWELDGLAPPRMLDTAPHALSAPFSVVELAGGELLVTSPSSARIGRFARGRALDRTFALAPSDRELLHDDPDALEVRFGERAFHEATRAGVSCQSCHLHGGSDGAFHNIGGRLSAPTLDVRGVLGTSPYLRDGSYPLLRDLHAVAATEYRGYREAGGDRARTLETWMRTLPPPHTHVARDPER